MAGKRKFSFAWGAAAAIMVFILFPLLMPQEKIRFTNEDGLITIAHMKTTAAGGQEDFARSFRTTDILDTKLIEDADLGEKTGSVQIDTKNFLAGSRISEELGTYDLLIYKNVNEYLWIETADASPILMNLGSSEMTRSFGEALDKYREEQESEGKHES